MVHGPHLKRPSELREREAQHRSLKDMSRGGAGGRQGRGLLGRAAKR